MTTIITLSHDTNKLPELISNWNELNETTQDFLLNCSDFRLMNSQEMLLYSGRQILASSSIFIKNNDLIYVESCWTKEGQLF